MNKYEEAIKYLKENNRKLKAYINDCIEIAPIKEYELQEICEKETKVVETAIEACELAKEEKHIPKKLLVPMKQGVMIFICPACGKKFQEHLNYCSECGQALSKEVELVKGTEL